MSKYIPRKQWFLTYAQVPPTFLKEGLLEHIKSIEEVQDYVVAQELHQDGGTHFHVYVKFKGDGVAPKDVLKFKWVDRTAKAESCRSPQAVMKYCKKDGDYITNIVNLVTYGKNKMKKMTTFLLEHGVNKAVEDGEVSMRGVKRLRQDVADFKLHELAVEPTIHCKGIWIHGPTGAGKTTAALQRYPGCFRKPPTKWWDGYEGQEVVLLDDLRKKNAEFIVYYLTQWMDRHAPPAGEVKGGNMPLPFKWFVVTSQWSIDEMFDEPRDRDAIQRRCDGRIEDMGAPPGDENQRPSAPNARSYALVPSEADQRAALVAYDRAEYAAEAAGDGGAESASGASMNGLRAKQ